MQKTAENTIKKYGMLTTQRVVVGVSGGCDSMALLHFLIRRGVEVTAVHINHMIREDAGEDAAFVERYCREQGIDFVCFCEDVPTYAKTHGISVEDAGRRRRYSRFEQVSAKYEGVGLIAVAHNSNDQAETVLMRLFRGSGLTGLCGIPPTRGNIIRPLIDCSREQIEKYCHAHQIPYRTDSTNSIDIYTRNKIRLNLIPYLQKEFNPDVVNALSRMADFLREDDCYLEQAATDAYSHCAMEEDCKEEDCKKDSVALNTYRFSAYNKNIQSRIVRHALSMIRGSAVDIGHKHVESVLNLLNDTATTGSRINLPNRLIAHKDYHSIVIFEDKKVQTMHVNIPLLFDTMQTLEPFGIKTYIHVRKPHEKLKFTNGYTIIMDYDKIQDKIYVRTRRTGDRLFLKSGHKKLGDFFTDKKVPLSQRNHIPLIVKEADETEVISVFTHRWHRVSKNYHVTDATNNVLTLYIWEDINNERSSK